MSCDELANKYQLVPNNGSFIKYIKLKAAIPISWEANSGSFRQANVPLSLEAFYDLYFADNWSTKTSYLSILNAIPFEATEALAE